MPLHPLHHVIGRRINTSTGIHDVWYDVVRIILVEWIKANHHALFLLVVQRCCCVSHARSFKYSTLQQIGKAAIACFGECIPHKSITEIGIERGRAGHVSRCI